MQQAGVLVADVRGEHRVARRQRDAGGAVGERLQPPHRPGKLLERDRAVTQRRLGLGPPMVRDDDGTVTAKRGHLVQDEGLRRREVGAHHMRHRRTRHGGLQVDLLGGLRPGERHRWLGTSDRDALHDLEARGMGFGQGGLGHEPADGPLDDARALHEAEHRVADAAPARRMDADRRRQRGRPECEGPPAARTDAGRERPGARDQSEPGNDAVPPLAEVRAPERCADVMTQHLAHALVEAAPAPGQQGCDGPRRSRVVQCDGRVEVQHACVRRRGCAGTARAPPRTAGTGGRSRSPRARCAGAAQRRPCS